MGISDRLQEAYSIQEGLQLLRRSVVMRSLYKLELFSKGSLEVGARPSSTWAGAEKLINEYMLKVNPKFFCGEKSAYRMPWKGF